MPDALFATKKAGSASLNPLLLVHQPAMYLQFLKELRLFYECDAPVAAQFARNASFAIVLASEPITCYAAVLQAAECN